jgi:hypothetical protein
MGSLLTKGFFNEHQDQSRRQSQFDENLKSKHLGSHEGYHEAGPGQEGRKQDKIEPQVQDSLQQNDNPSAAAGSVGYLSLHLCIA